MKTSVLRFSGLLSALSLGMFLIIGMMLIPSVSNAAQGCGHGFHRDYYGRCVFNAPGPRATPIYGHPRCWRNAWGQVRCYR